MAMTVVAVQCVASNIDYYITKYAAKPMEQLQNLFTQYALGLRRLELEEAEESAATKEFIALRESRRGTSRLRGFEVCLFILTILT